MGDFVLPRASSSHANSPEMSAHDDVSLSDSVTGLDSLDILADTISEQVDINDPNSAGQSRQQTVVAPRDGMSSMEAGKGHTGIETPKLVSGRVTADQLQASPSTFTVTDKEDAGNVASMQSVSEIIAALERERSSRPFTCSICSTPPFSDVWHLLTHLHSRAHLYEKHCMELESVIDPDARDMLNDHLAWMKAHKIDLVLAHRYMEKKKRRSRTSLRWSKRSPSTRSSRSIGVDKATESNQQYRMTKSRSIVQSNLDLCEIEISPQLSQEHSTTIQEHCGQTCHAQTTAPGSFVQDSLVGLRSDVCPSTNDEDVLHLHSRLHFSASQPTPMKEVKMEVLQDLVSNQGRQHDSMELSDYQAIQSASPVHSGEQLQLYTTKLHKAAAGKNPTQSTTKEPRDPAVNDFESSVSGCSQVDMVDRVSVSMLRNIDTEKGQGLFDSATREGYRLRHQAKACQALEEQERLASEIRPGYTKWLTTDSGWEEVGFFNDEDGYSACECEVCEDAAKELRLSKLKRAKELKKAKKRNTRHDFAKSHPNAGESPARLRASRSLKGEAITSGKNDAIVDVEPGLSERLDLDQQISDLTESNNQGFLNCLAETLMPDFSAELLPYYNSLGLSKHPSQFKDYAFLNAEQPSLGSPMTYDDSHHCFLVRTGHIGLCDPIQSSIQQHANSTAGERSGSIKASAGSQTSGLSTSPSCLSGSGQILRKEYADLEVLAGFLQESHDFGNDTTKNHLNICDYEDEFCGPNFDELIGDTSYDMTGFNHIDSIADLLQMHASQPQTVNPVDSQLDTLVKRQQGYDHLLNGVDLERSPV